MGQPLAPSRRGWTTRPPVDPAREPDPHASTGHREDRDLAAAQLITDELADIGFSINRRTVSRHLTRLGLSKRRFIDPGGESNRKPGKILARWPGHMVRLDVKNQPPASRLRDGVTNVQPSYN